MIPVVVAILLRDESFLMCQRPESKIYPLHWEFPGGKVEAGETPFEALRRELREELEIEISHAEHWFNEIATYSNGLTYDISYFLVDGRQVEPVNVEFNAIEWVTLAMLDSMQHLSGNDRILNKIVQEGIPHMKDGIA